MGKDLKKCRKERKQLQEENLALKQQIENMSSFSRDRISTLRSEGNSGFKPDRYYTADGVLEDINKWERLGRERRTAKQGAQKTHGGRRKTRKKRGGMGVPNFYKERVDRQEEARQWKLNRKMIVAKKEHDAKKQAKIKKQLQKSFKRQEYYHTPGDAKNKDAIVNFQIRKAIPEIEKAEREGRLVPRKTRKRATSAGSKRRKKTKKKRHIITRKNKRKRRKRTKKRKRGGMPKGPAPKKSGLLPHNKGVIKPKHIRLQQLKKGLTRSPTVRNLQQLRKFKPKFKPIAKETEEQSKMDEDLDSELSNIFSNMQTPTEGSRSHNMEKTLSSPKPE